MAPDMVEIREDAILAEFDRRHRAGTIFYEPAPKLRTMDVDGFRFEFAVTSAIGKKPYISDHADEPAVTTPGIVAATNSATNSKTTTTTTTPNPPSHAPPPPCHPPNVPGSDIDVSGFEIGPVHGGTHLLAYNKFCMYRPHLLLLTADGHARQWSPLEPADFAAAWDVLERLAWAHVMFFNCGRAGGCSRLHKHLQLAPCRRGNNGGRLGPWPERVRGRDKKKEKGVEGDVDGDGEVKGEAEEALDPDAVPYRYFLRHFDPDPDPDPLDPLDSSDPLDHTPASSDLPQKVWAMYAEMLDEARACLGLEPAKSLPAAQQPHVPHNLVVGRGWILVIPRRAAGAGGAYANALGMLGMVSVASDEELRAWLDQGPREVLGRLGVGRATGG